MRVLNLVLVGAVDQPAHTLGGYWFAAADREVEIQQNRAQRQQLGQQDWLGGRRPSLEQDRAHPLTDRLLPRERFRPRRLLVRNLGAAGFRSLRGPVASSPWMVGRPP